MKHRKVVFFMLIFFGVDGIGIIRMNPVQMIYAESPTPETTPTVDPSLLAQAKKVNNEALSLYRTGNLQGALDKWDEALRLYRRAGDRVSEAGILIIIGKVHRDLNQYDKALESYQQVLAIMHEAGDRANEAAMGIVIGEIYHRQGKHEDALKSYQQALAILPEVGTALNNIGSVYDSQGQYDKALSFYQQALLIAQEAGDRVREGKTLNNIGGIYENWGWYRKALELHQQSLEIQQEKDDRKGEEISLTNIGTVYYGLGQYDKAEEHFQQALEIAQEQRDRPGAARILNNLGVVHHQKGQYDKVLESYQKALEIRRQVKDQRGEGTTLANIGGIYVRLGQYTEALNSFQQALAIARELGDYTGEGVILNNIGEMYGSQGQHSEALEFYQQARAIAREVGNRDGERITLSNIGFAYESRGDFQQALDFYQRSIKVGESLRTSASLEEFKTSLAEQSAYVYQRAIPLEMHRNHPAEAFNLSESAHARTFLDQLGNVRLQLGKGADEEIIPQEQDLRFDLIALDRTLRQERVKPLDQYNEKQIQLLATQRDKKQKEYESLLTHLKLVNPEYASLISIDPLTLDDVQKLLDKETTLLSYFVTLDSTFAFVITRDMFQAFELSGLVLQFSIPLTFQRDLDSGDHLSEELLKAFEKNRIPLSKSVAVSIEKKNSKWRITDKEYDFQYTVLKEKGQLNVYSSVGEEELRDAVEWFRDFANLEDLPQKRLKQLYSWLIAPIKSHLKTPVVGIIPHGVLHYLPFAALTDGERYFGDEKTLFYLPSASVLPYLPQKRKRSSNRLLALAHGQAEGFPSLKYAEPEVQAIAKLYNTQPLLGSDATESTLIAHAGDSHLLHIAAHGQLYPKSPLFSRIILAPSDEDEADGSLEVHEVYGLDLTKANLVVLSACDTQLGKHSGGDDIIGLNRAFIYAGTPTVIASLWRVDDEATSVLMTEFYTHLLKGMGKAEALQAAQRMTRKKFPHPYYWAAFVLTGE
jgi:CHAT domain-containing protein/tetratricopeptide (TPR) repeat protein